VLSVSLGGGGGGSRGGIRDGEIWEEVQVGGRELRRRGGGSIWWFKEVVEGCCRGEPALS
jgi:hypothetical protein